MTPRSAGEWLALAPTAVALLVLVALTIFYMLTGEANAILFGTFGSLLGAGFGTQALAAARTPPPSPGPASKEPLANAHYPTDLPGGEL